MIPKDKMVFGGTMKKSFLLFIDLLICFDVIGCNSDISTNNNDNSQLVRSGFISKSFDESGNARIAISCLKKQFSNAFFEFSQAIQLVFQK